jgi:hypothetical protein
MKGRDVLKAMVVIAIGAAIYWMKPEATDEQTGEASVAEIEKESGQPVPDEKSVVIDSGRQSLANATPAPTGDNTPITTREIPGEPGGPPLIPALTLQKGELPWEKRINEVLDNSKIKDSDKGRLLIEMLPGLPAEGRETAAEYAVQRLDDADYQYAQKFVTNPTSDPASLTIMWADLLGRPETISLPTLLQVARNPSHPYAASARENLDLLLRQDYGTDWPKWETAIRDKLAKK